MFLEESIYKACCKGDKRAQKQLFYEYANIVRGICRRYIDDEDEAEDLLQETFIKVFTKIDTFTWNGKGSLPGWIKRIAVNTSINAYKVKQRFVDSVRVDNGFELSEPEEVEYTSEDALANTYSMDFLNAADIERHELLGALKVIPDPFRIVFNLFAIEGMRHKEIAEMLCIEEKTSRSRLSRARKVLQKEISALCAKKLVV